jgi:hypothetical protein
LIISAHFDSLLSSQSNVRKPKGVCQPDGNGMSRTLHTARKRPLKHGGDR